VTSGFLLDERIVEPIRELAESYRALLFAAVAPGRLPVFEGRLRAFDGAVTRMESSRQASEFFSGLDELRRNLASGARGRLVTIQPDRQPRVRAIRIGSDVSIPGSSGLWGIIEPGNSGSPVFVDGRLTGFLTHGLYSLDEGPGDQFTEAAFLRIRTVRDWLARRRLEGVLR
jgi:hypothetical protein